MKYTILSDFYELELDYKKQQLPMIVVYKHPADYPNKYVARLWIIGSGAPRATLYMAVADTLEDIRLAIPAWMNRLPRDDRDDPVIIETWL